MSTTTTNYGLIKPDTTDPILVGQLNDNADVIDATLKSLSDALDVAKLGIKYKGEVNYYSNLPSSGNQIGDAYTVKYAGSSGTTPDGTEYVWGTVSGTNQWINFSKDSYTKAEVDALLALKQNALTTAQLAAVNSGIDSTKVEQIETNKNNISTLTPVAKQAISFTASTGYSLVTPCTLTIPFSSGENPPPIVRISAFLSGNNVGVRGIAISLSSSVAGMEDYGKLLSKSEQATGDLAYLKTDAIFFNSSSDTDLNVYIYAKFASAVNTGRIYAVMEYLRPPIQ